MKTGRLPKDSQQIDSKIVVDLCRTPQIWQVDTSATPKRMGRNRVSSFSTASNQNLEWSWVNLSLSFLNQSTDATNTQQESFYSAKSSISVQDGNDENENKDDENDKEEGRFSRLLRNLQYCKTVFFEYFCPKLYSSDSDSQGWQVVRVLGTSAAFGMGLVVLVKITMRRF